jgi:glucose-6-phosphate isomerase
VRNRLGWLDVPDTMAPHAALVRAFADELRRDGIHTVCLLGMGGSSLCAEVLRDVPLRRSNPLEVIVLDTTDERTVHDVTAALEPAHTFFLVSSKSGGTIEVTSLERHFRAVMSAALGAQAGRHFAAITDPGTSLGAHAAEAGYRRTFVNPADIGGRYSALSLFGLVPGALAGVDPAALLDEARRMAAACREDAESNPGLALGAFMGANARAGRDKLTILAPPTLAPLGVWIEQLVAESTGKDGRGLLPVVGESVGEPDEYGPDRAFVAILTSASGDVHEAADQLERAGRPVFRIDTSAAALGAEFFRWEFATAVAGAVIQVNPFDEPNVRDAKMRTQAQLDARKSAGAFQLAPPLAAASGYSRREHARTVPDSRGGMYIAILNYLPADGRRTMTIEAARERLRQSTGLATTHGIGPRYLHSTGQYHKGGPNTGAFLLLTAKDATDTPVPDAGYSFSTLKQAQALGDFDALAASGRHVIHCHFDDPAADVSAVIDQMALALAR